MMGLRASGWLIQSNAKHQHGTDIASKVRYSFTAWTNKQCCRRFARVGSGRLSNVLSRYYSNLKLYSIVAGFHFSLTKKYNKMLPKTMF